MLTISAFCWKFRKQKVLILNILLRLRMSVYAYACALIETSLQCLYAEGWKSFTRDHSERAK